MPVDCVQVNSTVIDELWCCPGCWYWTWVGCICICHEIRRLHNWGCKHVLLGSPVAEYVENIDFLPRISWRIGVDQSDELESICVFGCHSDVELSILVASIWVQVDSSPASCVRSIGAEWWICEAWFSRCSEACSFQAWSWDLDTSLKICIVSNSWDVCPVINCLESTSSLPSKSSVRLTPSGSVPSECVPCFRESGFVVRTILPCCTNLNHISSTERNIANTHVFISIVYRCIVWSLNKSHVKKFQRVWSWCVSTYIGSCNHLTIESELQTGILDPVEAICVILLAHVETISRFVEEQMLNVSVCSNPITIVNMGWIRWIKTNGNFIVSSTCGCTAINTEAGKCIEDRIWAVELMSCSHVDWVISRSIVHVCTEMAGGIDDFWIWAISWILVVHFKN